MRERCFVGPRDVALRVRTLLEREGIAATLVDLPFWTPASRVEGDGGPADRDSELFVDVAHAAAAAEVLQTHAAAIERWLGVA